MLMYGLVIIAHKNGYMFRTGDCRIPLLEIDNRLSYTLMYCTNITVIFILILLVLFVIYDCQTKCNFLRLSSLSIFCSRKITKNVKVS